MTNAKKIICLILLTGLLLVSFPVGTCARSFGFLAGENSEENRFSSRAKDRLIVMAQIIIERLGVLRAKVAANEVLSGETRSFFLAEIDSDINLLKARQEIISEVKSVEELRVSRDEFREEWKRVWPDIKKYAGLLLTGRLEKLIAKAEQISGKIEEKIQALKNSGKDTTGAENLFNNYKSEINLAKENTEAAKAIFVVLDGESNVSEEYQQGVGLVKQAYQNLKQALADLRLIIKEIKAD